MRAGAGRETAASITNDLDNNIIKAVSVHRKCGVYNILTYQHNNLESDSPIMTAHP